MEKRFRKHYCNLFSKFPKKQLIFITLVTAVFLFLTPTSSNIANADACPGFCITDANCSPSDLYWCLDSDLHHEKCICRWGFCTESYIGYKNCHDYDFCSEINECSRFSYTCSNGLDASCVFDKYVEDNSCDNLCGTDRCVNGYWRNYYCSGGSCRYSDVCTDTCCDQYHGDTDAYCDLGVCKPPALPGDCTSGVCCDTSSHPYTYRPSSYVCNEHYQTDYGCPDGTSCGDDVKVRYKKRYCSGSSSSCSGSISSWGSWSTYDYCGSHEYCTDNDPSCNSQCSSGVCCDGCRYRPSSYVCNEHYNTDYSCPWGTDCGDDVGVRYQKRYCSGNSSTCLGTISGWGSYTVYDNCLSTETCTDNDSSCNYTPSCVAACDGDLTVSISGKGTCTVTASLSASDCDGKSWQVKDNGTTKCSGTVSGDSYSRTCSSWTVGIGSYAYNLYIDGNWKDSGSVTCSAVEFDFSISISPTSGSVTQGSSVSATVSTVLTSGSTQSVSFYILSGLPSGASASYSPTNCNPTCNSTMTINASATTPPNNYSINVCGTSGAKTHCVTYVLTVTEAGVAITPPSVTTGAATLLTMTSATLNGTLNSMGNAASCLVWFEWGTAPSYGNSTPVQTLISTGPFLANISGLSPNTTYYFKAFAKNGGSW